MRQILFRIPLEGPVWLGPLGEVPLFGWGLLLAVWVVYGGWWLIKNRKRVRASAEIVLPVVLWVGVAVGIVVLPRIVGRGTDRTIAETTRTIAENPQSARAYFQRGEAWRSKRAYAQAVKDYERAAAIDGDFVDAQRALAWVLATCPVDSIRDGKRALTFAERAAELTGYRDPYALDALAAASAEAGRFQDARRYAREAAELAAASPVPGAAGLLPGIRQRLEGYAEERPHRDWSVGKSVPVYGYGLMMVLGFFAATWVGTRLGQSVGIPATRVVDLAMWVFFSGVVGARIFYCIQHADRVFLKNVSGATVLKSPPEMLVAAVNLPDGGLVLYGGILLAIVVFFVYCWRYGIRPLLLADVFMASFFIGLGFGRIGCLMNGCCYGDRCTLPWGVLFPMGSVPDMALVDRGFVGAAEMLEMRLHPTQIYSSLGAFLLGALCIAYFRCRPREGSVLTLGLIAYPITRFVIEFLRGDEMGQFHTSLTIAQWVSMGLLAVGLGLAGWLSWDRPGALWAREKGGQLG